MNIWLYYIKIRIVLMWLLMIVNACNNLEWHDKETILYLIVGEIKIRGRSWMWLIEKTEEIIRIVVRYYFSNFYLNQFFSPFSLLLNLINHINCVSPNFCLLWEPYQRYRLKFLYPISNSKNNHTSNLLYLFVFLNYNQRWKFISMIVKI